MAITGKCHCGAVAWEASGAPEHHALCHCTDCRVWSGAPMVGWIAFRDAAVTITGETAKYPSSPGVTREFCPRCGTGLFYRNPKAMPGIIDIHSGTMTDYDAHPPGAQIMVKDRVGWMDQVEGLPKFRTYPGMD